MSRKPNFKFSMWGGRVYVSEGTLHMRVEYKPTKDQIVVEKVTGYDGGDVGHHDATLPDGSASSVSDRIQAQEFAERVRRAIQALGLKTLGDGPLRVSCYGDKPVVVGAEIAYVSCYSPKSDFAWFYKSTGRQATLAGELTINWCGRLVLPFAEIRRRLAENFERLVDPFEWRNSKSHWNTRVVMRL